MPKAELHFQNFALAGYSASFSPSKERNVIKHAPVQKPYVLRNSFCRNSLFISLGKIGTCIYFNRTTYCLRISPHPPLFLSFFCIFVFPVSDISRVFSSAGKFNEKEFPTAKRATRGQPSCLFPLYG